MEWYGWIYLAQVEEPVAASIQHDNEPSGSVKCYEILEWLRDWQLLKM
jgi:hypothetical protein